MPALRHTPALISLLALAACGPVHYTSARAALLPGSGPGARQLAEVKDNLDTLSPPATGAPKGTASTTASSSGTPTPELIGHGFAQVSGQPGNTINERRLMAMRAARMEAMRDLTEQIHGLHLTADTTVRDAVVQDDSLRATIDGTIRGARTVRITPTGDDGYEVEMAIDRDTLAYIVRALGGVH